MLYFRTHLYLLFAVLEGNEYRAVRALDNDVDTVRHLHVDEAHEAEVRSRALLQRSQECVDEYGAGEGTRGFVVARTSFSLRADLARAVPRVEDFGGLAPTNDVDVEHAREGP